MANEGCDAGRARGQVARYSAAQSMKRVDLQVAVAGRARHGVARGWVPQNVDGRVSLDLLLLVGL